MAKHSQGLLKLVSVGVFLVTFCGHSQLQFCDGNSGDVIFTETFGTGTLNGPPLPAGTTTYRFTLGTPFDGDYTITNRSNFFDWHVPMDRTPNDTNGKYFVINAAHVAGEFYKKSINGLCENTSYEFSSWLINLHPAISNCPSGGIPINVRFQIWDGTNTTLLASGDTGPIPGTIDPNWERYGLVFRTRPGQTSVILKMINNGNGGCGNDLAIDDIAFKTCGDFIEVIDGRNMTYTTVCENEGPTSVTLTARPDFSAFNSHFYQWQESSDGIDWIDIPGATAQTHTTSPQGTNYFYRVKVAEDPLNVSNSFCNVVSMMYEVIFIPGPNAPLGGPSVVMCENEIDPISVVVPGNTSVNWYDSPTGGNLLLENSVLFTPQAPGTYYAEASSTLTTCLSANRTAIEVVFVEVPEVVDESTVLCEGTTILLSANVPNTSYLWNTGETTEGIYVRQPGNYTVTVTNAQLCTSIKTIVVDQIDAPIIDSIESNAGNIEVTMANSGPFEYSLNGILYGDSPIFDSVEGGWYTIYVRSNMACPPVRQDFLHLVIPKFFTPNGDGHNDIFKPQGVEFSNDYEISIFNRFGSLIVTSDDVGFLWDGRYRGKDMPSSDYWYSIRVNNTFFKGHFTLKR